MIYDLDTPLGKLYAAFNDRALIKLSFKELKEGAVKNSVNEKLKTQLQKELYLYFNHKLKTFTVPIELEGTEFQLAIWNQLQTISFGKTISYKQQAKEM